MKKNRLAVWFLLTVFLASCPVIAGAQSSVSVIPQGMVILTEENGRVVQLSTTFPLKDGCLMEAGGGPCTIQGSVFSFTARDKTRFSMTKAGDKWVLTLHSGQMDYALRKESMMKFAHEGTVYDIQKITPAVAGGNVEGYAAVVGDKLVFTNTLGELVLVPTVAGVAAAPLVVAPGAAGGISATALGVGAGVAAAGVGAALGLSSGKDAASAQ
jgi:hypothetical protein